MSDEGRRGPGALDPPILSSWGSIFPPIPSRRVDYSSTPPPRRDEVQLASLLDDEAAADLDDLIPLP